MTGNSGQWCKLHDCHLDDPDHLYTYPECERNLRVATVEENAARDRKAHATRWHSTRRGLTW